MVDLKRYSKEHIQENVDIIFDWSVEMEMPLSIAKCAVLHYGSSNPCYQYRCGDNVITSKDNMSDLGVMRTVNGKFRNHVSTTILKGRRLVGLTMRSMKCRNEQFMSRIYKTYIAPILSYASQIWSPFLRYEITDLESIQRRFTKRILGLRNVTYGERLQRLELLSLELSRIESDVITVYKLIHGLMGINLKDAGLVLNSGVTRGGGLKLQQRHTRNNVTASFFMYRAPCEWNSLPNEVLSSPTLSVFRSRVRLWLRTIDSIYFV
jgi:hypothetical protein